MDQTVIIEQVRCMIAERAVDLVFGTQTVSGRIGNMGINEMSMAGGEQDNYAFSAWTIYSDWSPIPTQGDTLVVGTITYRVQRVLNYQNGILLRIDLGAHYQSKTITPYLG